MDRDKQAQEPRRSSKESTKPVRNSALSSPWITAAIAACVAAFAFRFSDWSKTQNSDRTYCYEGVATLSDTKPAARCFTVSPSGEFTAVLQQPPASSTGVTYEILPGYVIPGLWDGHGHLLQYGEFLHSVDLFGSESADEVRARVVQYLDAHPGVGAPGEWLRGVGWDQMVLGGMPTAEWLEQDERLKGLHIMLDRVDVHCVWVSQAVLDLLGPDVPDVPGGEIVRDPGMGVFCDNAMDLITAKWPRPDAAKKKRFIRSAMAELHKVGLVGMHDAGATPEDLQLFRDMSQDSSDWTLRVHAMLECKERNTFCPDEASAVRHQDDFLSIRSVKLFGDGALGSWGSAMLDPYTDRPDTTGSLLVNASTLTSLAASWSAAGWQVCIHAIGDLAARLALDSLEAALVDCHPAREPAECSQRRRFRIEHAQILHPADRARMHALGVLPSVQPTHATSDMAYAELRLGRERLTTEAYRLKSLLPLRPVLGSDFPVEPPDPFQGMYAAVTRRSPKTGLGPGGDAKVGFLMDEALTLDEALHGFTGGVAYGGFMEGRAGVIQEGALADWVVLDRPLGEYGVEDLRSMRVRETWVGGRRVYAREDCR
ncbi:uncharacterized protein E0L32_003511 [Thyridium curvatum]|uniref:Amidohydrolase 3 domain-containing protein n=1 Tax=Thyridium curvatum TaxID=1093900 RepID=A0A507BHU9_9PEZI|nr:uncharacterized protein E0L32_003511 [Thyridium curvatum]TPX16949.1 hypothetical protein E0L32_003511 [Thyridium curvatum]